MQGIRPSSRWLPSGPSIGRQCLLLAPRGLSHYPSRHDLRQFSGISSPYDIRGGFGSRKPFLPEKQQSSQSRRYTEKPTGPAKNTVSRFLICVAFPFVSRSTSMHGTTRQHGGFRRQALWLYRILWLLGIGYTTSAYLLPSPISSSNHAIFSPPRFTPFSIIAREDISPSSFILTLRPHMDTKPDSDPYADNWNRGPWSVEFKQPQLQIARSYTPLPPSLDAQNTSDLQFLIRREKGGEVSNYLADLPLQATIHIRGPYQELDLPTSTTDVVFLAGGTGIAPAMQVAYTLLERRSNTPKPQIHIIWANRKRMDCMGGVSSPDTITGETRPAPDGPTTMVVRALQLLQQRHPKNLKIDYMVDEEGGVLDRKTISASSMGAAGKESADASTSSRFIFVSGPEGFVGYLAGPKKWEDGKEKQGDVGGVIGRMNVKDWKVWKM